MERLTIPGENLEDLDSTKLPAYGKLYWKLNNYEDLEEQGKLLKLPCTVGDTIYVIPSKTNYKLNTLNGYEENNRVYEQVVNQIEISKSGYLLLTCDSIASVIDKFYKETWFLTREEAEAALKNYEHPSNNKQTPKSTDTAYGG